MLLAKPIRQKQKSIFYVIRPAEGGMRGHLQALLDHFRSEMEIYLAAPEPYPLEIPLHSERLLNLPCEAGLNPVADLHALRLVYRTLRRTAPALVHVHGFKAAQIGLPAASLAGIPALITVHNYPAASWARRFLPRLKVFSRAPHTRYIAVSHALAEEMARWGISREKITVIHNGIDPEPFEKAAGQRSFSRTERGRLVVGTVARLVSQKGVDLFLQAAVRLAVRYPAMRFRIVGDGPERENLYRLALRLGLLNRMVFTGHSDDIAAELALMDIFVLPSLSEGLGVSLLEAFASGCAVVAARVGGVPEVVEDGHTGLLVPPADGAALAAAVAGLVENPENAARLARNARERVRGKFSLQAMLARTAALYEDIFAGAVAGGVR